MKSFSRITKLYLFLTYGAGGLIFASHVGTIDLSDPFLLLVLCVIASMALILKVEGSTNRSHYTFNFLVYGFTFAVLGPSETILVIVVSNLVEWIWNRPPWFIQLFNTGSYLVVTQASAVIYDLINPGHAPDTWQTALALLASLAAFDLLNHLMVGGIISFARGESFKQSGVFDLFPLMLDLSLLYFGASLSIVWRHNAFALGLFLIPLYLIYSTLRVPALERKTEIDAKTGLFNHEYFTNQLKNELPRANRFDRPLCIILADLDLLRNINNTYGHLAGDEVLKGVARVLQASVRDYDVVCRFGGEEFAILLPETTLSQAYDRAELIRKAINETEFTVPTSMTAIRATMSFGIAQRENFAQSADEIMHNADLALYHSKLSGRNRTYAYSNDAYVDFLGTDSRAAHPPAAASVAPAAPERPAIRELAPADLKETGRAVPAEKTIEASPGAVSEVTAQPKYMVALFIGLLALVSVAFFGAALNWMPLPAQAESFDWFGLIVLSALIVVSESFSIDLYFRQNSVSTSALPILVAYLVFGSVGVVTASLVLAISLLIKYRSHFSRFIFNLSNHILAGTLILGIVAWAGGDFIDMSPLHQILLSLASAAVLYLTTTFLVALGMSLDMKQPALELWREQFRWLAPHYLGIGFIAYALIFGYRHDQVTGLLLMMIPMILLRMSQKQYLERTRVVVTELREKNQTLKKNSEEIHELNDGLLLTLSEIIDLRDPYVLGHSKQVSQYATDIARLMGLHERQLDLIRRASLLHDIGKLGVSMEILTKPGRLTQDEYEAIKVHSALGGDLVKSSPSLRPLIPIIRHHHEHFNGAGYPDQLSENQIAIEARIVAVADAIEAMTSDRPYRKGLPREQVIRELTKHAGTQFDPLVVETAVRMLNESEASEALGTHSQDDRRGPQISISGLHAA